MKLDSTFAVTAPIEDVWTTLMDFEKVAGCVPGAQVLNKLSEDAYQVGMKVKLGPVTMQYKGQMEVLERDAGDHRAVLKGQAKEARGQGTAQATAHLALVSEGAVTRGTVSADVALNGRAAAMGQGVIGSVTDQMMAQFATNLQVMLNESGPATDAVSPAAPAMLEEELGADDTLGVPVPSSASSASVASSASAPSAPVEEMATSLDGLTLVRGMLGAQLKEPSRVAQVVSLVALLAYALGRRSARRDRDQWVALLAAARE